MILLLSQLFFLSLCYTTCGAPISGCDPVGYFCYWRSNTSALSNYDAQAVCAADQGRLPIFSTSTDYNNFVTYKNSKTAISGVSLWLGYWNYNSHSASAPGSWSDKNGTGLSGFYTNWNAGEPNDASPGEKCVNLNGNMNDLPCTTTQNFVCQSRPYTDCNNCEMSGPVCFFYSTGANNIEAQSLCASNGATLPTFSSSADLTNLNTWTASLAISKIWVGYWNYAAHSASAPGTWRTQNGVGPAGPYLPWNSGEPNDSGGNEKCVETSSGSTVLNDNSCSLFLSVTVCQCLATPPTPTTTLTCANCNRTAANCYLTINAAATNTQAKSLCSSAGGVLATFKNITELNSFRKYWWPRRTDPSGVWLGYWNFASHSASAPGIWTDQNGNPTSYAGWNNGEPSDSHGNEKCAGTTPFTSGMNDVRRHQYSGNGNSVAYTSTTSTSSTSTSTTSAALPTTSTSTTSTTLPITSTSATSTTLPTTSTSTSSTTLPTTSTFTTSTTLPTTSTTSTTLPMTSTFTTSTTFPTTSTFTTTSNSTTFTTLPTTPTSTTSTTFPTTSTFTTTSNSTTSTTLPTTSTSTTSTTLPITSTSATSTTLPTTSTSTSSTTLPTTSTFTTSTTLPTTSTTSTTLPMTSTFTTSTTLPTTSTSTTSTTLPTTPTSTTSTTFSSTSTFTTTSNSTTSTTLPTTSTSTTSTTLPTTPTSTTSTTFPTTSTFTTTSNSTTSTTLATTSTSTTSTTLPTTSTSTTSTTLPTTSTSTISTTLPTTSTSTTFTTLPITSTSTTSTTLPTSTTSTTFPTTSTFTTTSTSTTSTTLPSTSISTTSTTLPTTSTSTTSTTLPSTSTFTATTTLPTTSTSTISTTLPTTSISTTSTTLPTTSTATSIPTTFTNSVISQDSEKSALPTRPLSTSTVSFSSAQENGGVTMSSRSSSDPLSFGKTTRKYTVKPTWLLPLLVVVISAIAMVTLFVCCWIYCGGKRKRKNFQGQTDSQAKEYL